jgi:hypothetical protein
MVSYYDLNESPPTHDFCNWLIRVEQERRAKKEPFVDIVIVPGSRMRSPRDHVYSIQRKIWRIDNLLAPLARCLPSARNISTGEGKQTLSYLNPCAPVVTPVLKAPPVAASIVASYLENKPRPVSITLRQSEFEPIRNSTAAEWRKTASWLEENGYTPIVVPDGEALMTGSADTLGRAPYAPAAMSPELRLALYEQCVCNLMTTGGPMVLALMAEVPLMAWRLIVPGIPCATTNHMRMSAMSPEHYWGPYKKLYWTTDSAEVVTRDLEKWLPVMEQRGIPVPEDVFSLRDHELVHKNGEEKWKNLQAT